MAKLFCEDRSEPIYTRNMSRYEKISLLWSWINSNFFGLNVPPGTSMKILDMNHTYPISKKE